MSRLIVFVLCSLAVVPAFAQPKTDSFLQQLLSEKGSSLVQQVLHNKDSFRVQIIYTRIDRDKQNRPTFTNFYFNVDSNLYFNPASTVKLPLTLLALEKLNELKIKGVNRNTPLQIDSSRPWQRPHYSDSSSENNLPSIAQYIRRAMLISENDPYNRLYQFVGQQAINRNLYAKGYTSTRITRQFLGLTLEQNRHTNAMRFLGKNGKLLYAQPPAYNTDSFYFDKTVKVGRAYYNRNDSLIHEPIDFTRVNNLPLLDFQQMLQSVMFPQSVPAAQRFRLSKDDYRFMYRYLSQYPSETNYPKYDTSEYYDSYVKFFFRDSTHQMPPHVRVFNKVGWAYGFLIDASYVADFKNKVEYMLAATVYVNSDGVLNDDKYEFETVGWPFLQQLGQVIYQYELARPRKFAPRLDAFSVQYEQRDPNNNKPAIKNADN